ncbi:aurora kinase A-B-like [Haliotis rufescens]|uniref:aurora kinase A-B-like n=1 Tax=Haliotis rufescens TaxID=6454 RepID=UPI00201E8A11|nr:aurora kinase A-B-like [Haliotis rufescens]
MATILKLKSISNPSIVVNYGSRTRFLSKTPGPHNVAAETWGSYFNSSGEQVDNILSPSVHSSAPSGDKSVDDVKKRAPPQELGSPAQKPDEPQGEAPSDHQLEPSVENSSSDEHSLAPWKSPSPTPDESSSVHGPTPTSEKTPSIHRRTPTREKSPSIHGPTPSREKSPSVHGHTPTRERSPSIHVSSPSREKSPSVHGHTPTSVKSPSIQESTPTREKRPSVHGSTPTRWKSPVHELARARGKTPSVHVPAPARGKTPSVHVPSPARGKTPLAHMPDLARGKTPSVHVPAPARGKTPSVHMPSPARGKTPSVHMPSPVRGKTPLAHMPDLARGKTPSVHVPSPARGKTPLAHVPAPTRGKTPSAHVPAPARGNTPSAHVPAPARRKIPSVHVPDPGRGKTPSVHVPVPGQGKTPSAHGKPDTGKTFAVKTPRPPDDIPEPNFTGQLINGYHFESLISSGGAAVVYRVKKDGVLYAAKVSMMKCHRDGFVKETWENEFNILTSLNHHNIIKAYELFRHAGRMIMIMELVKGYDMDYFISNHSVRWRQKYLKTIAKQVFSALRYLHRQNIVHRDIKPDNILIGPKHTVKIIDFGGALKLTEVQKPEYRLPTFYTPVYAPPEVHTEDMRATRDTWARSFDVWSTGVTIYEALTGKFPFPIKHDLISRMSFFYKGPDFAALKNIDSNVVNLVKRCLDLNPSGRITARRALQSKYFWGVF